MSEQIKPKSYTQELDAWTNAEVIIPLMHAIESGREVFSDAAYKVERAIREKVLESYHNGKAAFGYWSSRTLEAIDRFIAPLTLKAVSTLRFPKQNQLPGGIHYAIAHG